MLRINVIGEARRALVYLPPGYRDDRPTGYPVLYLLHGVMNDEASWTIAGLADVVFDLLNYGGFDHIHLWLEILAAVALSGVKSAVRVQNLCMLTKLLALLATPATQLVRVLNQPGQQLAQVLSARKAQLEEQE